jgi:hypothetical protein
VLADLIAWMPCRSSIDRRGPVGRVLRDVRRDVEVAQSPLLAPVISHAPDFARDIALDPAPDSRCGSFSFSDCAESSSCAASWGGNDGFELGRIANMCGSRPQAEGPGASAHFESSLPGQGVASGRVSAGHVLRVCWSAPNGASSVIETMEANGRRKSCGFRHGFARAFGALQPGSTSCKTWPLSVEPMNGDWQMALRSTVLPNRSRNPIRRATCLQRAESEFRLRRVLRSFFARGQSPL